jgi:hypothetical protein
MILCGNINLSTSQHHHSNKDQHLCWLSNVCGKDSDRTIYVKKIWQCFKFGKNLLHR